MDWKDYTHQVGGIVTNLQALETVLRYFLLRLKDSSFSFRSPAICRDARSPARDQVSCGHGDWIGAGDQRGPSLRKRLRLACCTRRFRRLVRAARRKRTFRLMASARAKARISSKPIERVWPIKNDFA
jgi:hypothetical protein